MVVFSRLDHGKELHRQIDEITDREVHYIAGETDKDSREMTRQFAEKNDVTIVASLGVFSTGVNIKKIDNIVFASPSKSRIRNLQSIGRGLRKTEGKDNMRLFDIADDLQCENYTLNHLKERINTVSYTHLTLPTKA
mgnify:CR=1 FL=1